MKQTIERYQRIGLVGIILIALGVVLLNALDDTSSLGTVLIAVGGLFFMAAMKSKMEVDKSTGQEQGDPEH